MKAITNPHTGLPDMVPDTPAEVGAEPAITGPARTLIDGLTPVFANNAAALSGGLAAGNFYRTGGDPDHLCVVH